MCQTGTLKERQTNRQRYRDDHIGSEKSTEKDKMAVTDRQTDKQTDRQIARDERIGRQI